MVNLAAASGVAIAAAVLAVVLRRYHAEYGLLISLGAGAVLLLVLLQALPQVFSQFQSLLQAAALPAETGSTLLKALGACWLAQFAADACRDAGEGALASKVELAGKTAVLLLILPLFAEVANLALNLASAS